MRNIHKFIRNTKYKLKSKNYKINPFSYSFFCDQIAEIKDIESISLFEHYNNIEHNKRRILIRHDVDLDPWTALEMSKIENKYGLTATYFFLHSAKYYKTQLAETLCIAKEIQSLGHEIGLHNNLITDYFKYKIDPAENLTTILKTLRNNGLKIYGSASHGSKVIRELNSQISQDNISFTNYLIFDELFEKKEKSNSKYAKLSNPEYNNISIKIPYLKMKDYNLYYEAYFIKYHYYVSDTGRKFWYSGNDPIETVKLSKNSETAQLLFHPVWWKLDL